MEIDEEPLDHQVAELERMTRLNPALVAVLERLPQLDVPDCWLAAGAVFETVWNVLSDREPTAGILDYDVNYFDASDLSWDAEDAVITRAADVFAGVDAEVQVRNEARVHLWYEERFGVPCPPYRNTRHAISTFPNCSSCIGVRLVEGSLQVFAPYGLSDLFAMRTRPNPVPAPRRVYEDKVARWSRQWPRLTVLPWPDDAAVAPIASARDPRRRIRRRRDARRRDSGLG